MEPNKIGGFCRGFIIVQRRDYATKEFQKQKPNKINPFWGRNIKSNNETKKSTKNKQWRNKTREWKMVQSGCLFSPFFSSRLQKLWAWIEKKKKSFRKNRHLREESVAAAGRNWIRKKNKKQNNNKHFIFFHNDLNFLSTHCCLPCFFCLFVFFFIDFSQVACVLFSSVLVESGPW